MNISQVLKKGLEKLNFNKISEANLKVKMLLSSILNVDKSYLIINEEKELENSVIQDFLNKIDRLCKNEPIQYIINKQEFFGIDFYVDKRVLIPQPDTEVLVEETLKIAQKYNKSLKILDLCTGSGAIAISLFKNILNVEIYASDISEDALEVAKINANNNNCNINFIKSNLFENINKKFDIIVSNPPYIETNTIDTLSSEVKYEPRIALDGKEDGLYFYTEIAKNVENFLENNGCVLFEIGYNQKEEVIEILKKNNLQNIYSKKDLSGNDRIVVGYKI